MNTGRALAVLVLAALGHSLANADEAGPSAAAKKPSAAGKTRSAEASGARAGGGGLVVFVDPATGKVRQPDAAEIGELVRPPASVTPPVEAPLVVKNGPAGTVGVVLDSRYESFMVVTKTPGGGLSMSCVTGEKKADEAVASGANTPPKTDGGEAPGVR